MIRPAAVLLAVLLLLPAAAPDGNSTGPLDEPITAIPYKVAEDPKRAALGAALFTDRSLSFDGLRACASCHDLRTNGASGRRFDAGPDGKPLPFNTPTVFNAALNFRLDWTGNARTLEQQAKLSLAETMGVSTSTVVASLAHDPAMLQAFRDAYGRDPDEASLLDAIASFERTLVTPDSDFDLWLAGDASALSADALDGYHLFKSIGCVSCHQGRNVGGNLFERSGIFRRLAGPNRDLLRVPSLRNVAVTPPYFSDGSAATLEVAVGRMARAQLGLELPAAQAAQIATFLRSLTGRYQGQLLAAPP
jgi:cytochrome c peroxidase